MLPILIEPPIPTLVIAPQLLDIGRGTIPLAGKHQREDLLADPLGGVPLRRREIGDRKTRATLPTLSKTSSASNVMSSPGNVAATLATGRHGFVAAAEAVGQSVQWLDCAEHVKGKPVASAVEKCAAHQVAHRPDKQPPPDQHEIVALF